MTTNSIPTFNERIKRHGKWNAYKELNRPQPDLEQLRRRALTEMVVLDRGQKSERTVDPICVTAERWVREKPGSLREHGIAILAYWGALI